MPVAETLGIVGSILAIVQISKTIISLCEFYIDGVDGASSDLQVILIEISALKGIAESLEYLIQSNVTKSTLLNQLAAVTGPIEGCKKALKELEALFPSAVASMNNQRSERRRLDAAVATLAWPLKKGKTKRLLQIIIQHKTTINLALTAEFVHDLKDVKQKTEEIQDILTESERQNVYKWLETTNPSVIHNRSQKLYEPGTASWVLRTPHWPLWIEGKHRCLWIHGIPGAGKSILASFLAEEIEKHCKSASNENSKLGHAYYYCYFGHNQDESSPFLRWVIGQLCRQSTKVPNELQDIYKSGKIPTLSCLLSILHNVMEGFERIYLVLDAVDESMPRADLLRVIRDLSTDARFSALGLLVTSRRYIDIEQVLEACSIPITMSNPFVEEDIRTFVLSTVKSDPRYQKWPEQLRCEMQDSMAKKANGMFRWAVCQLDILKRLRPDVSTIRAALSNLPKTLDETYERMFLTIPEDDWLSVQHVFHWIVYHNDLFGTNIPLRTLLQAVQQSTMDFLPQDADQLHDFEGLRECCGCLIVVEQEEKCESYSERLIHQRSTVSFAHYTVKEYLQSPRISQKKVGFFALAQERMQNQFAGIAFRQALAIQPDQSAEYEDLDDDEVIHGLLDADFKLYCGVSSVLQLKIWPEAISSNSTLMELSEAVSPKIMAHFRTFLNMAYVWGYLPISILAQEFRFWWIEWRQEADTDSAAFLAFLLIGFSDSLQLALAFARRHSMLTILKQELHIKKEVFNVVDDSEAKSYNFVGSIPEIVAQWEFRLPGTFAFILDLISELGVTHFDPSTLLLLYVGCHQHHDCSESCSLKRLLQSGASANGPEGAFVTPLQIAVVCWDLQGVEILLNAGAEPNALGKNGSPWASDSLMERFNHLHGVSSLHIINHFQDIYRRGPKDDLRREETTRGNIEARLLEFGGVEIEPSSSQPESDGNSDKKDTS